MIFAGIGEIKGRFKNVRFILGVVAFAAVAVGGCASAFHLGHPERALHILGNMGSAFSRELFAVGAMAVVSLVYAVLAKKSFEGAAKVFGIIGAVVGVVLPLVAGATYVMAARPVWDTFLLPVMFLGTGVGMGFLLACALVFMKGDEDDKRFALTLALAGVVVMAVAMVLYVAWIAMAPHADESRSIMRLVAGRPGVSVLARRCRRRHRGADRRRGAGQEEARGERGRGFRGGHAVGCVRLRDRGQRRLARDHVPGRYFGRAVHLLIGSRPRIRFACRAERGGGRGAQPGLKARPRACVRPTSRPDARRRRER